MIHLVVECLFILLLGTFLSLVYSCDMYSFLACQSVGAAGRDFVAKIQRELAVKEYCKGQLISKANCQAVNSSKKRTNVFTTM